MRYCVPRTNKPADTGPCSGCGSLRPPPPILWTSLAALTDGPFLSQKPSERPTNIRLWELERGAESSAFVLSVVKNKLIRAELNAGVQLDKQRSPSGSRNFSVFTSGFSTLTLTFTHHQRKSIYLLLRNSQFKFSCGLVPGGKSPFGGQALSQGSGTLTEGSRCLFSRLFPLQLATEGGNQHQFRL